MAVFAYQALDAREQVQSGTLAADSAALARQALRARGLAVATIAELRSGQAAAGQRRCRFMVAARRRADARGELWSNLAVLLDAGVPLADALVVCLAQHRGAVQSILRQVLDAVRGGQALADALAVHGAWFDPLTLALVRVAERSGALAEGLRELAEYEARRRAVTSRLTTALIYPAILCATGLVVVLFLTSHVIPQLLDVLTSAGRELPAPTRLLKVLSDVLVGHGLVLAAGAAASAVALTVAGRTERGRRVFERLVLSVPAVGALVRQAWIARISLMLAALLRADVRFTAALRTVRQNLPHRLFADELAALERALEAGAALAAPLRRSRLMPPLVVHLLAVGQESGELPRMLDRLRAAYEQKVQLASARFLAVLEPALILVLAVIIGFVVFATLLPILETTRIVQ